MQARTVFVLAYLNNTPAQKAYLSWQAHTNLDDYSQSNDGTVDKNGDGEVDNLDNAG